jgi:tryptophan synthase beta chain
MPWEENPWHFFWFYKSIEKRRIIMKQVKILLEDKEIPKQWYNIVADLPTPMKPPLHPGTGQPVTPDDLAAIFPMNIIEQEASSERWIDIPDEVLQKYLLWRPSPLYRAYNFEKLLNCPVKIYYKNEGVSPAGSHKPNAALPMAYFNKQAGTKRIVTETGAGQWGSALAMATQMFGLDCRVYMVKVYEYLGRRMHSQPQQPDPGRKKCFGRTSRFSRQLRNCYQRGD